METASSSRNSKVLTGVEIGTSAVKVAIGEADEDGTVSIHGVGEAPIQGVVKGEITHVPNARQAVQQALETAEKSAARGVRDIFLAVTGGHIQTEVKLGRTPIQSPEKRISEDDVVDAVRNAKTVSLPSDRRIINSLDRRYLIDGDREIVSPVGHPAGSLETEVLLIVGSLARLETPCKALHDVLGYPPADMTFSAVAACLGALYPEQLEQGTLLIDIGAGVTEYALFSGPGCFHAGQVAVGCNHIANDLAIGLRLSYPRGRQLLLDLHQYGSSSAQPDGNRRIVRVDTVTSTRRHIPVAAIEQVIELRLRELFEIIAADIRSADAYPRAARGAVLCGGGSAIPGIRDLASRTLGMPAQAAAPVRARLPAELADPQRFLVPIGLIRFGDMVTQVASPSQASLYEQLRNDFALLKDMVKLAFRW